MTDGSHGVWMEGLAPCTISVKMIERQAANFEGRSETELFEGSLRFFFELELACLSLSNFCL